MSIEFTPPPPHDMSPSSSSSSSTDGKISSSSGCSNSSSSSSPTFSTNHHHHHVVVVDIDLNDQLSDDSPTSSATSSLKNLSIERRLEDEWKLQIATIKKEKDTRIRRRIEPRFHENDHLGFICIDHLRYNLLNAQIVTEEAEAEAEEQQQQQHDNRNKQVQMHVHDMSTGISFDIHFMLRLAQEIAECQGIICFTIVDYNVTGIERHDKLISVLIVPKMEMSSVAPLRTFLPHFSPRACFLPLHELCDYNPVGFRSILMYCELAQISNSDTQFNMMTGSSFGAPVASTAASYSNSPVKRPSASPDDAMLARDTQMIYQRWMNPATSNQQQQQQQRPGRRSLIRLTPSNNNSSNKLKKVEATDPTSINQRSDHKFNSSGSNESACEDIGESTDGSKRRTITENKAVKITKMILKKPVIKKPSKKKILASKNVEQADATCSKKKSPAKSTHGGHSSDDDRPEYVCQICECKFASRNKLNEHQTTCRTKKRKVTSSEEDDREEEYEESKKTTHLLTSKTSIKTTRRKRFVSPLAKNRIKPSPEL